MAEVAGLIMSALSLATLLDSVITNFEKGKDFKETYDRILLQLEVLRLRLDRWRNALSALSALQDNSDLKTLDSRLFGEYTERIEVYLRKAKTFANAYGSPARATKERKNEDEPDDEDEHENNERKKSWLVGSLRSISRKYRNRTFSTGKKIIWAIYGEPRFESLIKTITQLLDDLEGIISSSEMRRRLEEMRAQDAKDIEADSHANRSDLIHLINTVENIDKSFAKIVNTDSRHSWHNTLAEDEATLHQGHEIENMDKDPFSASNHSWSCNTFRGRSKIHQGHTFRNTVPNGNMAIGEGSREPKPVHVSKNDKPHARVKLDDSETENTEDQALNDTQSDRNRVGGSRRSSGKHREGSKKSHSSKGSSREHRKGRKHE